MTGCQRILARLEQGPATHRELYANTYSIVHSRIAELRKQGHRIECERDGDEWIYRLLSGARAAETGPTSRPALEQAVTRIDPHARLAEQLPSPHAGPVQVPLPGPGQLSLLA